MVSCALEVDFNNMRYINLHFTLLYLLTAYIPMHSPCMHLLERFLHRMSLLWSFCYCWNFPCALSRFSPDFFLRLRIERAPTVGLKKLFTDWLYISTYGIHAAAAASLVTLVWYSLSVTWPLRCCGWVWPCLWPSHSDSRRHTSN